MIHLYQRIQHLDLNQILLLLQQMHYQNIHLKYYAMKYQRHLFSILPQNKLQNKITVKNPKWRDLIRTCHVR